MPFLEASDAASVIAISSVSGREIDMVPFPYGTMKAAIVHYTAASRRPSRRRASAPTRFPPATPTWQTASGARSRPGCPTCSPLRWRANPPGAWELRPRWPTPWSCWPAPRASRISGTNLVVDGALTRGVQL